MATVIIHEQENGIIAIITPVEDCGIPIEEIARKDVTKGMRYLIVDTSDLPLEHLDFSDAWEADFSNHHGIGIGHDAWFAEQSDKENGEAPQ